MIFSRACIYTIRAVLYLAVHHNSQGSYIGIHRISRDLEISFHFLTKVLQKLGHANLVTSYRGPRGGVALARPAADIKPIEIVHAIDGDELLSGCVLGLPGCGTAQPCPLHDEWLGVRDRILNMLEQKSLAELAQALKTGTIRLNNLEKVMPDLSPETG